MSWLVIDYETASACDLKACGSARYSEDPTTEILCLSIRREEGSVFTWRPGMGVPMIWHLALKEKWPIIVHNATFEKDIYDNIQVPEFGWPLLPPEQVHCTLSVCALKGIPQGLDQALARLRLPGKDKAGSKFTIGLSKPNKKGELDRSPEAIKRVIEYCESDTEIEAALHSRLGFLDAHERAIYLHNQVVNRRGVAIDLPFVKQAQIICDLATGPLAKEFRDLTGCDFSQGKATLAWCKSLGNELPNLQKETVELALGTFDDEEPEDWDGTVLPMHPVVRRALEIRQLVGSTSIKKLKRLEQCVSLDGRARNALQYHGTLPGRNAGRLWQPQNFPRGTIEIDGKAPKPDALVAAIMTGDPDYVQSMIGPPIETVVSSLRHALIAAPGHVFLSGDYAGIQARVVLALAGQWNKLELMASGQDVYCDMASQIFKKPITKADKIERQYGKNSVLGLGFGMGHKKFHVKYCKDQPVDFAESIVGVYRKEWAPGVPKLWHALMDASTRAVHTKKAQEAYGLVYALEDAWLTCTFPGGSKIHYYNPVPTRSAVPWDDTDIRPGWSFSATKQNAWVSVKAFGGLLTENAVMHIEREIMAHGMLNLEAEGIPVVLDVHDEILCEVPEWQADEKLFQQVMTEAPSWVKQYRIPLAVESWQAPRYQK
jgi:DNA polymerase bacteriophage-type